MSSGCEGKELSVISGYHRGGTTLTVRGENLGILPKVSARVTMVHKDAIQDTSQQYDGVSGYQYYVVVPPSVISQYR